MTLDEAIQHCKEKACGNTKCSEEHKQLAEWLMELKELRKNATNIEYTRTDAFIEKACEWIRGNYLKYPNEDCADTTKFVIDFKNYMKRE